MELLTASQRREGIVSKHFLIMQEQKEICSTYRSNFGKTYKLIGEFNEKYKSIFPKNLYDCVMFHIMNAISNSETNYANFDYNNHKNEEWHQGFGLFNRIHGDYYVCGNFQEEFKPDIFDYDIIKQRLEELGYVVNINKGYPGPDYNTYEISW